MFVLWRNVMAVRSTGCGGNGVAGFFARRFIFFRKTLDIGGKHVIVQCVLFDIKDCMGLFSASKKERPFMKVKVPLYVISAVLAIVGFPTVLGLIYLDMIDSGIPSKFFWVASVSCCILSILSFSLAHILVIWAEEDQQE
jgi:hypothetical protein